MKKIVLQKPLSLQGSVGRTRVAKRVMVGMTLLLLSSAMIGTVGFASKDHLHNAAHDTRHALGFPCH